MEKHSFVMNATWQGGRLGTGKLTGKELKIGISIPSVMGGPGIGTNPEELLIGSAMNCYIITLAALLEKRQLEVLSLSLTSEGILTVEAGNLDFRQIIHRPHLVLKQADEKAIQTATYAIYRAEQVCMISKALRGNVEILVEPTIEIANTV